ncbi:hypothetical protein PG985_000981 [Apiospora marii]|uniref:Uncharacterized protein n=1 Tax=Apiospora marii TaxID=335849 RepID=A0ABR1RGX0_9PEZI
MDPNIYLLMRMLQSHSPGLAGANWKQIAAEMNQHQGTLKQVTCKPKFSSFYSNSHLVPKDLELTINQPNRKKFAAMRKEFLENQASKGAAGSPAAAAPASKKRGRTTKAAGPVDAGDDDAELDGTPAKRQRRCRPSNNGKTTAAEVEAGSEKGDDDEV